MRCAVAVGDTEIYGFSIVVHGFRLHRTLFLPIIGSGRYQQ